MKLKSDQDGIESAVIEEIDFYDRIVEIRPRWDWKFISL